VGGFFDEAIDLVAVAVSVEIESRNLRLMVSLFVKVGDHEIFIKIASQWMRGDLASLCDSKQIAGEPDIDEV